MTNTPSPDEDRELIEHLRDMAQGLDCGPEEENGPFHSALSEAADRLESLLSDREQSSGGISGSRASTEPQERLGPSGFDPGRVRDLELALELALAWLGAQEPGDSRAVSNEFVSMAAILCDIKGNHEECRQIIRAAIAMETQRAETPKSGSVATP